MIFVIVSLKTGTHSLTSKSVTAGSQSNKSTALFIWSEFASEKCHISHKVVDKKLLNQTFQELFGGGSGGEEKHVLQIPLP